MSEPTQSQQHADLSEVSARFLELLADPTRRRIFLLLMGGEVNNSEPAGRLGLAQNRISHHLRQLRQAGLIRTRRDDQDQRWIYYSIELDALRLIHGEIRALVNPDRSNEQDACPASLAPNGS
ncbi:MAG: winged helix-turn-helix transcriptional regulator [Chloroflexi bacterium]|nr:winged helix-turn-helix transcriptional regulator [Chloroflexota bacterium]